MTRLRKVLGLLISLVLAGNMTGGCRHQEQGEHNETQNQPIRNGGERHQSKSETKQERDNANYLPSEGRKSDDNARITISTYSDYTTDTARVNAYLEPVKRYVKAMDFESEMEADSILRFARKAADLSDRIGYYEGLVDAVLGLYAINCNLQRFAVNKDLLYRGIRASNHISDYRMRDRKLTRMYNFMASLYGQTTDYDSAVFYYLKAIALSESQPNPDSAFLIQLYDHIGSASISCNLSGYDSKDAIVNLKKGAAMALAINDRRYLGSLYHNTGEYFQLIQKQYDSAYKYFNLALAAYRRNGKSRSIQQLYLSMAITSMFDLDNLKKAGLYIDSANRVFNNDTISQKNHFYQFVTGAYHVKQGEYTKAIPFFEKLLRLSQHEANKRWMINAYINLATCYDSTGNFKKASYYKTLAYNGQQELMNATTAKTIASARAKYDLARKDKVIAENQLKLLRQQNSLQRQYLITGSIALLAFLLIGTLSLLLFKKQQKAKLQQLKGELAGEERERKRLAQELHDGIVSRLSAIRMNLSALSAQHEMIRNTSGYTDALNQLEQGIKELRNTSHNLMPGILEQIGLVAAVKSFCSSISESSPVAIDFVQIGALPDLPAGHELHIYRILQELISNIIKHSDATQVLVQFRTEGQHFQITLDDNSTEQEDAKHEQIKVGIGQYNIRNRMELMGGKMEVEHAPDGTSVYFSCKSD